MFSDHGHALLNPTQESILPVPCLCCHGHFFLELLVFRRFEEGICEYIMGREFRLEEGSILYVLRKEGVNGRDGC
jgi:hypothetical protein